MTETSGTRRGDSPVTDPPQRICRDCRHYRVRAPVALFSAGQIVAPGVLKELTAWQQEERQRAQQEYQKFLAREPFSYEPHNYAWCAKYSGASDLLNPVTGEPLQQYVLCAWVNPNGRCEGYEPRDAP